MVVFLIGFMGSGKTTLGRLLARETGFRFVDMDKVIEESNGMSVGEIFCRHGEPYFRGCERDFLSGIDCESENLIIATGGGAPCEGDNMEVMNRTGRTVYLKMTPEMLLKRLQRGKERRPKIQGMNDEELLSYIRGTLAVREGFYSQAGYIIDCDGASDRYIVDHLREYIRSIKTK